MSTCDLSNFAIWIALFILLSKFTVLNLFAMLRCLFSFCFFSFSLFILPPLMAHTPNLLSENHRTDTIPVFTEKKIISRIIDGEEITSIFEKGKLTGLNIDGIDIPEEDFDLYRDKWDINERNEIGHRGNSYHKDRIVPKFFENDLFDIDLDSMFGNMFRSFGFKFDENGFIKRFDKSFDDFDFSQEFYFDGDSFDFNLGDFFRQFSDDDDLDSKSFMRPGKDYSESEMESGAKNKLETKIGEKLNLDGLLVPDRLNDVELTGKYLKINGEKQNDQIFNRYKSIFEEETGIQLDPKSKLFFKIEGKKANRKLKSF
jgi:hypothetical protein